MTGRPGGLIIRRSGRVDGNERLCRSLHFLHTLLLARPRPPRREQRWRRLRRHLGGSGLEIAPSAGYIWARGAAGRSRREAKGGSGTNAHGHGENAPTKVGG